MQQDKINDEEIDKSARRALALGSNLERRGVSPGAICIGFMYTVRDAVSHSQGGHLEAIAWMRALLDTMENEF